MWGLARHLVTTQRGELGEREGEKEEGKKDGAMKLKGKERRGDTTAMLSLATREQDEILYSPYSMKF